MLTHDQITEKVDTIGKAGEQIGAALTNTNRLIGQPGRLNEALKNVRRKSDLIVGLIAELKKDREDRAAARAAVVEPAAQPEVAVEEKPVPAAAPTPQTDKALAEVDTTNVNVAAGPAALMADKPVAEK